MDAQYGEISRAMRNRGVEIYILGEVKYLYLKGHVCSSVLSDVVVICSIIIVVFT